MQPSSISESDYLDEYLTEVDKSPLVKDLGIPTGFKVRGDGLFRFKDEELIRIGGPIFVVAILSNDKRNWGRLVEFRDIDENLHELALPMTVIGAGDGVGLREVLLEEGYIPEPGRFAREGLIAYLTSCKPRERATSISRSGWHDGQFTLPDGSVFGRGANHRRIIYQSAHPIEHAFRVRGTLEDWRQHIGSKCVGNSRLILAVSCAFAAPLLRPLATESGGIHLVGSSSKGKTTALKVAGSVMGGDSSLLGFVRTWRATQNGLEGVAALHNDGLLPLDEISQLPTKEASEVAFLLANGQGKSRAHRDGSARPPLSWQLLFLSSGNVTLADKIHESGRRPTGAELVRIVDVPADTGAHGLFEHLHGAADGKEFSDLLCNAAARYFGTPLRAFLEEITKDPAATTECVRTKRDECYSSLKIADADGQILRVSQRFALIAAAGELATEFGITGWKRGDATVAAAKCFAAWLDRLGSTRPAELEAGIAQIRLFLEQHGESRFSPYESSVSERGTINRCGFRRKTDHGFEYYILPESFKSELCKGFDSRALAAELVKRDHLIPDSNGKTSCSIYIPVLGQIKRVYHFRPTVMEDLSPISNFRKGSILASF